MAVSKEIIALDQPRIAKDNPPNHVRTDIWRTSEDQDTKQGDWDDVFDLQVMRRELDQFELDFDRDTRALWCRYRHLDRPCYTSKVLDQILRLQSRLSQIGTGSSAPRYLIWASNMEGVFNLGGDLDLFVRLIRCRDEQSLRRYAYRCVDTVYNNLTNMGLPLLDIALVQGDALGGGFEAALTSDVIIAERQSKFGLPEILFNLFPGMGAYSLLCRRLDGVRAKRMILSGRLYDAEEMHELGLVDVLAEPGEGKATVQRYIDQNQRRYHTLLALGDISRRCQPISREELIDVTDLWVDTTLNLQEADLRRMERLVNAQKRRRRRVENGI